ncbi:MAG TPA: O-methyltransferase [Abditibacteriaceae bacterium]|jgi:caffeoyl-CoA O-methyltransferase
MEAKYISLDEKLNDYVLAHSGATNDDLLNELRARTEQLGDIAGMLISREQGTFLTMLAMNATNALEIGTFTGYSSTCIARGLKEGGHLTCLDVSEEWTSIAREFWAKGGVADRITLHLGPAGETFSSLPAGETFDLVFIDADKPNYDVYYELVLPHVPVGGLIVFDNMLWHGKVTDESINDEDTVAIRQLNDKLTADTRIFSVLLPVGDGLHLCRKL